MAWAPDGKLSATLKPPIIHDLGAGGHSLHRACGGDKINVQNAGANDGLPAVPCGRACSEVLPNGGLSAQQGMQQPVCLLTASIAPSGMTFCIGNLLVASPAGKRLVRLLLDGERLAVAEPLLHGRCRRICARYQGRKARGMS